MAVNPNIKKKADDIRNKIYGKEVRESLASGLEEMSSDVVETAGRQDNVESQFQDVIDNTTGKDVISAPEIIAARNGEANLKTRIDKDRQEVTAQLAQTADRMNEVSINPKFPPIPFMPIKSDANYYDEANFRYYKDEAMTIPATDNSPSFQAIVNYVHSQGGGKILLPSGNYAFKSKIVWRSKVSLIGANKITTKLFAEGENFSLIEGIEGAANGSSGHDPSVWFEGCHFENFLIDNKGLSYDKPSVGGKALFILYMKKAVFRDLILLNTIGTALGCDFLVDTVIENVFTYKAGRNSIATGGFGGNSGIGVGTSALSEEPLVISNCFTYESGNYGIFVETQQNPTGYKAKYAKVINSHAMGNRLGFGNKGSGGTAWIGCSAISNRQHGFHLTQGSYGDSIVNCIADNNGQDGVRVENEYLGDLEVSHLKTNSNGESGFRARDNIVGGLNNIRLSHIKAHKNGHIGVWTQGDTKNLSLSDIDVVNNGQTGETFNRGVKIDGVNDILNMVNIIAFDDQEVQTQKVGVEISATTTNYILDDINVVGYTQSTGLINKASLDSGTLGTIQGYKYKTSGTASIKEGFDTFDVVHGLGSIPKAAIVSPRSNTPLWIRSRDGNIVKVARTGTVGITAFDYYIEK